MTTIPNSYNQQRLSAIHPLKDAPERKCSSEGLGRISMTPSTRLSLGILRAYLIAMTLMLAYHVLDMAGVFQKWK